MRWPDKIAGCGVARAADRCLFCLIFCLPFGRQVYCQIWFKITTNYITKNIDALTVPKILRYGGSVCVSNLLGCREPSNPDLSGAVIIGII